MGLRNNVSMLEMEMQAYQWCSEKEEYVTHDRLAEYIRETAMKNDILKNIKFGTRVSSVRKDKGTWTVESVELLQGAQADSVKRTQVRTDITVANQRTTDLFIELRCRGHSRGPLPCYPYSRHTGTLRVESGISG